jgi:ABC-type bacteriocin/lantibiotic exporter with double-glycine peptidase domain
LWSTALAKLRPGDWSRLLAVAGQNIDLIEGTVEDNIRMARRGASAEEVAAAARIAGAMEIIERLPEGHENWIGQQGMNLSGGQRQRIALARAVLCDSGRSDEQPGSAARGDHPFRA